MLTVRENGYYWVKYFTDPEWQVMEYMNKRWFSGHLEHWESELIEINEVRIPNPDEENKK